MADTRAASRYAKAILEFAIERNELDKVNADFAKLESMIRGSRDFYLFLKSPVINTEKKRAVFSAVLKDNVTLTMYHFILLLTTKNRETIIPEIIEQFHKQYDEREGIINVTLRTASKFSDEQQKSLIRSIQEATKKNVRLQEIQDAELIGGFTVSYEDTVLDGSVRQQLAALKERLVGV